ncbi:MAG: GntR family transcriptional regulator [Burkholderiales bacterium]|nr:MAG: GntR family transcriptional regulator [Burkholderiales bacterium]
MQSHLEPVETGAPNRRGGEVQRIFRHIIADITEGVLRPGEKISEPELARAFGVSRGPLREAIRRLEERQLVRCTPNFGARVVSHTPREVLHAYEIREALEGLEARLAAANMSDAEIRELREVYVLEVSAARSRGYLVDFHMQIVRGSHNQRLIRMLNEDYYYLLKMWRSNCSWLRSGGEHSWTDHKRILEAIEYRDQDSAEMLMRRHVARLRIESSRELERLAIDLDAAA